MPDVAGKSLEGLRLLIVEDDYMIATDLALWLEDLGVEVIGPAASVDEALALLAIQDRPIDGAVLDINLGRERVYPVADALLARSVRFLFVTGYDSSIIPEQYWAIPRHEKPFNRSVLLRMLAPDAL